MLKVKRNVEVAVDDHAVIDKLQKTIQMQRAV